jgi:hypothetical protein
VTCAICKAQPATQEVEVRDGVVSPQCDECYRGHLVGMEWLRRFHVPSRIRAITLQPPWSMAMAAGWKGWETRGWAPRAVRTGALIAVTTSAKVDADSIAYAQRHAEFLRPLLALFGARVEDVDTWPKGCALSIHRYEKHERCENLTGRLEEQELFLGNYGAGRYGIHLPLVCRLPEPVAVRGALNIWQWPDLPAEVRRHLPLVERDAAPAVEQGSLL